MNRRRFLEMVAAGAAGVGVPRGLLGSEAWTAVRPGGAGPLGGGDIVAAPLAPRSRPAGPTLFTRMESEQTGIFTQNRYDDPEIWRSRYADFKVGSIGTGIAIGDYDNDGRADIFVVSKTESCRLFRNLGGWKFEDVTERAGVADVGEAARIWKQGATFVDVNNDGLLDLYVCRFGAPNLLYINQGDGTFREEAAARGLAVRDGSIMAAFCDYDRDGWLDVLVQTNAPESLGHPQRQRNYLFHNNGDGTFKEVTERAGIAGRGQGHAAIWWDFDEDGWPDLYIGYDFSPPDRLFRNNRDGTFSEVLDQIVPHTPFSSMGADLGDVNNDGRVDLFVSDMAATNRGDDLRTIANARAMLTDPPAGSARAPQYMRNALYLNTGMGRCLEAAFLAGVAATDWTWSVRLEDLDNDGRLDLFVTNGMYRDLNDFDLIDRVAAAASPLQKVALERAAPELAQRNLAFRNRGDLRFEDVSAAWGLDEKGISFGAAFGDLDGDGDLDLVYANYHGGVTVLRNDGQEGHRAVIHLRGSQSNRFGIGATVRLETDSGIQVRPLVLARGLMSSSEPIAHFGLGSESRIRRLTVSWPSGAEQSFTDLPADHRFTLFEPDRAGRGMREGDGGVASTPGAVLPRNLANPPLTSIGTSTVEATPSSPSLHDSVVPPLFRDVTAEWGFSFASRELELDELAEQPLLPFRQNRRGPALAVGDIFGDGRDHVAIGGTPADPLRLVRRGSDGRFQEEDASALTDDSPLNDGPLLLFDAFGDGRADLLITKGGVGMPEDAPEYQPRLYENLGGGRFRPAPAGTLPQLPISVGAVAAADFDRDGRLDLFIGGRVVPGRYPLAPRSALLANRGSRFEDVTDELAPGLRNVGLVTAAVWSDIDGDGWPDLLVAVEWGQVRYFHNRRGAGFEDWTERAGFASAGTGWWSSLASADFNGDGRPDFVVGNVGLNTPYRASARKPVLLYRGDFSGDGTAQLVEGRCEDGQIYPRRARRELGGAIPQVLRRCPDYAGYARASLEEMLGAEALERAERFSVTELRSGVFLSQPDGSYRFEPLPRLAPIAPIQGLVAGDFDGDGRADICCVQNSFAPVPCVGRFDGGLGQYLRGDGRGGFEAVPASESGIVVAGDAKGLALGDMDEDGWPDLLASRNFSTTLAFRNTRRAGGNALRVRLAGPAGNPAGIGARITLELADGSRQVAEVHAATGHYSQSTAAAFFGWPEGKPPRRIQVRWPSGQESVHPCSGRSGTLLLRFPA